MGGRLVAERYQLEERVGSGGMGVVWRATDLELGRQVALKRSQAGDSGQIRREARIGAGVQHTGVVTVFDAVADGDDRWLVMEYLPSRSLSAILDEDGPLEPPAVARIGVQLADALAAMHAKGVVHRDVKPGNVLVTADGTAKLTDLGIARWAEVTRTDTGEVGGTPGYLAPEVAEGHEATAASDVFALGATLFAAVEGESPWGTTSPIAQLRRAAGFKLETVRRAGELAPVLTALLRRKPAARPTAAEAGQLLAAVAVAPAAPAPRPRRRWPLFASIAAVVAVLGAAGALVVSGSDEPRAPVPRLADPCALADRSALSRFGGHIWYHPDYGGFNGCGLMVSLSAEEGDTGEVRMELLPPGEGEGSSQSDDECVRTVTLWDGTRAVFVAKHSNGRPADFCGMADAVAKHAAATFAEGALPERPALPPDSLARLDACALLDAEDITAVIGPTPPEPGWGNWECYWESNGPKLVDIYFGRETPPAVSSEGAVEFQLDGRLAYVETGGEGYFADSCQVEIVYRNYVSTEPKLESIDVVLKHEDTRTPQDLCAGARTLAEAVSRRLPPA